MRQYYLLGRDNADGLKQSVVARERMDNSPDETMYPMPDLSQARYGPRQMDEERFRLQTAELALQTAQQEINALKLKLQRQKEQVNALLDQEYKPQFDAVAVKQQEIKTQLEEDLLDRKRFKSEVLVGFEKQETWWAWVKRLVFRL